MKTAQQTAAGAAGEGWKFTDSQAAVNAPTYALMLPYGGALVIFYTRETASWTAMSSSAVISPGPATGLPYSPPSQILSQLGISAARPGLRVSATAIDESLAIVPPAGRAGVTIVVTDSKGIGLSKS